MQISRHCVSVVVCCASCSVLCAQPALAGDSIEVDGLEVAYGGITGDVAETTTYDFGQSYDSVNGASLHLFGTTTLPNSTLSFTGIVDGITGTTFVLKPPTMSFEIVLPLPIASGPTDGTGSVGLILDTYKPGAADLSSQVTDAVLTIEGTAAAEGPLCMGDTNTSGSVNVQDLINVILDWGTSGATHGGDTDSDGSVNVQDVVNVIVNWGPCTAVETGACCFYGIVSYPLLCEVTTEEHCSWFVGGTWTPGVTCDDSPCPTCPSDCGPDSFCNVACGQIVMGVECPLFQDESGGLYVLSNLGGFGVGDYVTVAGCFDNDCATDCQQGNGCLLDNFIGPCNTQ